MILLSILGLSSTLNIYLYATLLKILAKIRHLRKQHDTEEGSLQGLEHD